MPSNKCQSNKIKKKLADSAKKCKSVTAFFRYTVIFCYSFVAIGSTQSLGSINTLLSEFAYALSSL